MEDLKQQIEDLKKQIEELKRPKPTEATLKHNHSGGDYVRIKFGNLIFQSQAGTTKTTPGTVNAWLEVKSEDTIYYLPLYTSKTS